jgi:hypothetical protein
MEFASPMHQGVYEMVLGWLQEPIEQKSAFPIAGAPGFVVRNGSAYTQVLVQPVKDKPEAIVEITCMVAKVERIEEALVKYLLSANLHAQFCSLGVDFDNKMVIARGNLLGSTCDPKEFFTVLGEIVSTADWLDDQIVKAHGGQTSLDHFRQMMETAGAGRNPPPGESGSTQTR